MGVESDGKPIFQKGLPFQAKKLGRYRKSEVLPQVRKMLHTSESGIVVRFGADGYDAADARHLATEAGKAAMVTPAGFASLQTVLGDWFLQCQIGRVGLSFHREEKDPLDTTKRGFWVIDTEIRKSAAG